MRFLITILMLFFGFGSLVISQSQSDFYAMVDKSVELLYQDPDECIRYTQNILNNETNIENRLMLQNIIAQAFAMKGDYVQSIRVSLETDLKNPQYQSLSPFSILFLDYALAEQYQNLRLFEQSEALIRKVLESKEIYKSEENHIITLAKVKQLHAINLSVLNDKNQAQKIFEKSNDDLKLSSKENFIIYAENRILETSILVNAEKFDEAKQLIDTVIDDLRAHPNDAFLFALSKERLARIHFLANNHDQALDVLKEGFQKIESLDYLPMKSRYYEVFAKNYLAIGDENLYKKYQKLYLDSKTKLDANQKEGIRFLTKLTETHQNQILNFVKDNQTFKTYIVLVSFALLISALVIYYYTEMKRSKDLKKQLEFFEKQKQWLTNANYVQAHVDLDVTAAKKSKEASKKQLNIPKETEVDLLQKLQDFEQSDRFLSKEMSLAVLASQLETNTKYLSEIINHYKEKNFNAYVNELRINYIALKLKTDPAYLQYKVSYLAEEAGFSSHSSFTTVFKAITGMSPNIYIQQINRSKS